jgi:hypothetical protein
VNFGISILVCFSQYIKMRGQTRICNYQDARMPFFIFIVIFYFRNAWLLKIWF